MDANSIDYYIINCAIPSIITIENRYHIDFGKPVHGFVFIYLIFVMYMCCHLSGLPPLSSGI